MNETSALSPLTAVSLVLILATYTAVSYPSPLLGEIVAGTLLVAGAALAGRWLLKRQIARIDAISVFLLIFSTSITLYALTAQEVYGEPSQTIDITLGYALAARLLHYAVTAAVVLAGRERSRLAGLGVAAVYTSVFYSPTFATPEAGPPFIALAALALVLFATTPFQPRTSPLTTPLLLFGLLVSLAAIFSYSQSDSLIWLFKLLTLLVFILMIPALISTQAEWKGIVLLVSLVSVGLPVLLSAIKLIAIAGQLGIRPVLDYRLGLTELGRANLIAGTLMVGGPFVIAQAMLSKHRIKKFLWWSLSGLALIIFIACYSWGSWIGLGLTLLFALALKFGPDWIVRWKTRQVRPRQSIIYAMLILILVVGLIGLAGLALQLNEGSFNGRLFQFRAALAEISQHPLLGLGPGHYFVKSKYTSGLDWLFNTQVTQDNPLEPEQWLRGSTRLHTHNLFLEIAVGIGLPGLLAFVWFLIRLIRLGLQVRAQLSGPERLWVTSCLIGLLASLGWGLLDVMEISPPFFTFPTWTLVGLLWAAPRIFEIPLESADKQLSSLKSIHHLSYLYARLPKEALCLLASVIITVLLIGNWHYRQAYLAYRERRWTAAADGFLQAARWEPLNAKYQQLRGEALINLSQYAEATTAYEQAIHLKRDFAPYHAQLGWLYWLHGDLEQATRHFQKAIEMDPREAWRTGLHADLGLAYAAQGQIENAIPLFKETIELDPQMALAPYWIPVQRADGKFDVILDPVYTSEPEEAASLQVRMVAHLGKADYTPRLFALETDTDGLLSFNQILDAIEEDYLAAQAAGSPEAPRLLATLAEAAQLAGLSHRAEQTYVMFQEMYPRSAYGFRDLGILFHLQGRWPEAQEMLEHAINVSPKDTPAWYALAEVYLDQGALKKAEGALDIIYQLSPLEARLYTLRARLYRERGDLVQTSDSLRKSLLIRESIPNRLALSDLYRQQGQTQPAADQCLEATESLLHTRPRPLAPELWEIGACLAQSSETDNLPTEVITLARESPLIGNIVLGHFYRIGGQLDQALAAYQQAAEARPDESAPYFFQGETYQGLGQFDQATTAYRQATQLNPFESLPSLTLGRMQWNQGDYAAALSSFRAATESTPGWDEPYMALGNALWAQGNLKEAGMNYQTAQYLEEATREGMWFDFGGQLASAMIEAPGPDYVRGDYFAIDGRRQRVVFMHPTADAQYIVTIPEGARLAFDLATAPESWTQPGDGVSFIIDVLSSQGVQQLFSTYIDPKHNVLDRRWHTHLINLKDYAGQTITLRFETRAGPTDDNRYDWAGWGEPRLLIP